MRARLVTFPLALILIALVVADEDLLDDGLDQLFDGWTTEPASVSDSDPGTDPGSSLWSLDGGGLIQDSNVIIASLPINEDESGTDFWAGCSPGGLGARDDQRSCPVPLKNEDVPTLPTLRDVEKTVGSTPGSAPQKEPGIRSQIVPFLQPDPKCPPTHPYHLCCICDNSFAYEVCQDCLLCKQVFFSNHLPSSLGATWRA